MKKKTPKFSPRSARLTVKHTPLASGLQPPELGGTGKPQACLNLSPMELGHPTIKEVLLITRKSLERYQFSTTAEETKVKS
jgi:hypothetical protein